MEKVLKYTYLMDVKKIEQELQRLWDCYQKILNNPNWDDLNEARAILYLIGYWYPEEVAVEAIERRLHLLKAPLTSLEFFELVDSKSEKLTDFRKDEMFAKLEKFYELIKHFKNLHVGGKWYLDEEKFVDLYNKYTPDANLKIRERGKFGDKK